MVATVLRTRSYRGVGNTARDETMNEDFDVLATYGSMMFESYMIDWNKRDNPFEEEDANDI